MKNKFDNLTMAQQGELMKLFIKHGYRNLDEIKNIYNTYADGGLLDKPLSYEKPLPQVRYAEGGTLGNAKKTLKKDNVSTPSYYYGDYEEPIIPAGTLSEVDIVADAMYPRRGDKRYDNYVSNTYDAYRRGDVDVNTLPMDIRNNVLGERNRRAVQEGMNNAALPVLGTTVGIPAAVIGGINALPYMSSALDVMGTPFRTTLKAIEKLRPVGPTAEKAANVFDVALDAFVSGKTLKDVAISDNGVKKTFGYFNNDEYSNAVKSGLGDLFDIATSVPALKLFHKRGFFEPFNIPKFIKNKKINKNYIESGQYKMDIDKVREAFDEQRKINPDYFKSYNNGDIIIPTIDNIQTDVKWSGFFNPEKTWNPFKWKWEELVNSEAYNKGITPFYNEIYINPLSKFLDPKKFRSLVVGHEPVHSFTKGYKPKYGLSEWTGENKYYTANTKNPFYNVIKSFDKNKGKWIGSPEELQAEMFKWKIQEDIPLTTIYNDIPSFDKRKEKLLKKASERFKMPESTMRDILTNLSFENYFKNGGEIK